MTGQHQLAMLRAIALLNCGRPAKRKVQRNCPDGGFGIYLIGEQVNPVPERKNKMIVQNRVR